MQSRALAADAEALIRTYFIRVTAEQSNILYRNLGDQARAVKLSLGQSTSWIIRYSIANLQYNLPSSETGESAALEQIFRWR
jgi:hypothetical protein